MTGNVSHAIRTHMIIQRKTINKESKMEKETDGKVLGLEPAEHRMVKAFVQGLPRFETLDVEKLAKESPDTVDKLKAFLIENPAIISKMFHSVKANPELLREVDERVFNEARKFLPGDKRRVYVPPQVLEDPLGPQIKAGSMGAALILAVVVGVLTSATEPGGGGCSPKKT